MPEITAQAWNRINFSKAINIVIHLSRAEYRNVLSSRDLKYVSAPVRWSPTISRSLLPFNTCSIWRGGRQTPACHPQRISALEGVVGIFHFELSFYIRKMEIHSVKRWAQHWLQQEPRLDMRRCDSWARSAAVLICFTE